MKRKNVCTTAGLAGEGLAQLRILRRHADRAGVEVADAHHDAAHATSGAVAKPNSSAPSSAATTTSRPVLSCPSHLHDDAVAQVVEQQHLLRFGQAEFPGHAGVLETGERRGAGAAVVAADEHDIGVRLRHAGGDGADADSDTSFT
jgi:hypothetical protein